MISIAIIWTLGFIIAVPSFIVNDLKTYKLGNNQETLFTTCEEIWINDTYKYMYSITTIVLHYLLPLIVVSLTNLKICYYLQHKVPYANVYSYQKSRSQTLSLKHFQTQSEFSKVRGETVQMTDEKNEISRIALCPLHRK